MGGLGRQWHSQPTKNLTKRGMGVTHAAIVKLCRGQSKTPAKLHGGSHTSRGWIMRGRSGLLLFLAIAIFFGCASSVLAQGTASALLNGTVTDASGGSV